MGAADIRAHLWGPAKVGQRWIPAGAQNITAEERDILKAEGLLAPTVPDGEAKDIIETRTFTVDEWEAAVAAKAREYAGQAFDGELDRLKAEVKEILAKAEAETAELEGRLTKAEAERDDLRKTATSLQGIIEDLEYQLNARAENSAPDAPGEKAPEMAETGDTPARTDTPPSAQAAKTAPKKGAAATKG